MTGGAARSPVIVGGGLAGGAAALRLAQRGLAPLLLERQGAPHDKVCGEFLSVEAARHLAALGVEVAALGGAPIHTVRLHVGARQAQAPLPFLATGLTRRTLDDALLDAARRAGAAVEQGTRVLRRAPGGPPGRAVLATGVTHAAPCSWPPASTTWPATRATRAGRCTTWWASSSTGAPRRRCVRHWTGWSTWWPSTAATPAYSSWRGRA